MPAAALENSTRSELKALADSIEPDFERFEAQVYFLPARKGTAVFSRAIARLPHNFVPCFVLCFVPFLRKLTGWGLLQIYRYGQDDQRTDMNINVCGAWARRQKWSRDGLADRGRGN